MSDLVSVILTGPAKIGGERKAAGATVSVPIKLALELAASGVINPSAAKSLSEALRDIPLASDFDAAVADAVAEREAYWSTAFDHFETMAEDREIALERRLEKAGWDIAEAIATSADLQRERDAAVTRAEAAEAALKAASSGEEDVQPKPAAKPTGAKK